MNNKCLKTPPMDNILPYLFNTNVKTTMHNKNVFQNTLCETFTFLTRDVLLKHALLILNYQIYHLK
jgi:hypothetical protein